MSLLTDALARCPARAHARASGHDRWSDSQRSLESACSCSGRRQWEEVHVAEESFIEHCYNIFLCSLHHPVLDSSGRAPQVVLEGGWHNRVALPVLNALGVAVMRTWNSSLPLWQYHHSYQWPVRARCCVEPEQLAGAVACPCEMYCHASRGLCCHGHVWCKILGP